MHCGMCGDISGLYPLHARGTPFPGVLTRTVTRHQMNVPWEAELSLAESLCFGATHQQGMEGDAATVGMVAQAGCVSVAPTEVLDPGAWAGQEGGKPEGPRGRTAPSNLVC